MKLEHLQPTNLSIKFSFNSNLMTKITHLQRASVNFDTFKEYQTEYKMFYKQCNANKLYLNVYTNLETHTK